MLRPRESDVFRRMRRRNTPFSDIPADILLNVSDYLGSRELNAVSSGTWDTLGHRHAQYAPSCDNIDGMMEAISNEIVEGPGASFKISRFDETMQLNLFQFLTASAVRELKIIFDSYCWIPEAGYARYSEILQAPVRDKYDILTETVIALNASPYLHTLQLDFNSDNNIREPEAEVISELMFSPSLQVLRLNFPLNNLNTGGCLQLSKLKHCPILHTLFLNIWANSLVDEDLMYIALLKQIPKLHTMCIDVGANAFGKPHGRPNRNPLLGVKALVDLQDFQHIHTLALSFNNCHIPSMNCFVVLQRARHLYRLELKLERNNVGDGGADALANTLNRSEQLRTLRLDLTHNNISDTGASCLATLAASPVLRHLHLILRFNPIGYEGAVILSQMKDRSNTLTKLYVDLDPDNTTENLAKLRGLQIPSLLNFDDW
jgi:hypothetical protein